MAVVCRMCVSSGSLMLIGGYLLGVGELCQLPKVDWLFPSGEYTVCYVRNVGGCLQRVCVLFQLP